MDERTLSTILNGMDSTLTDTTKAQLEKNIRDVSQELEAIRMNRTNIIRDYRQNPNNPSNQSNMLNSQIYTNLSDMINGTNFTDPGGFETLLSSLYAKNKKAFSIIKDYELMPILIPQINRVLMFLVNECLSPDIQNNGTFIIKYAGGPDNDPNRIQQNIEEIKKEMKLDNLLREVYTNRYKLGKEYYTVVDYNKTFDTMLNIMNRKMLGESTVGMSQDDYFDQIFEPFSETVDDLDCTIPATVYRSGRNTGIYSAVSDIVESSVDVSLHNLNIQIRRSAAVEEIRNAQNDLLQEMYSNCRTDSVMDNILNETSVNGFYSLNESIGGLFDSSPDYVMNNEKTKEVIESIKKKHLNRCEIKRLDPAKIFKLTANGGRIIGYLHISDIAEGTNMTVNFAQALKDQLLKSRATNMTSAMANAETIISKRLAEKIINTFDPNIGINRIEDIDLLHNFIETNQVYLGNKRITFYYQDEIFDMSRADDSILINSVFFSKLYSTLLLNNVMTKILRGRGRQIHTIHMGASPNVQRYLQNAMAALTMPENNLGTLHGSFEQILNPFNSASDLVIPTDDDTERFITTDYIPGQDVDMNDEFLKFILNSIITTFGVDPSTVDVVNGQLQFARTLTMESLQICTTIRNEQQDLHDSWEAMCLKVLEIEGDPATRDAVKQGKIKVEFYEPLSLIVQNTVDDLNNAKNYAEAIADVIPEFNIDGSEQKRNKFIYKIVKDRTNIDFTEIEHVLSEIDIDTIPDELEAKIRETIQEYKENIKMNTYGDTNGDGVVSDNDLTPEEQDLMNSSDEEL